MTVDLPASATMVSSDAYERRWLGLGVISLGVLVVTIDLMVMLIALPTIGRELNMSTDLSQWVITAYALTYGALLLLGGRIADYTGRRRAFVLGVAGFAIASALGGAAQGTAMLLAARGLQGAFAALLMPAALSLISVTFVDVKERARALTVYAGVSGSGLALGMVLGGVITEYLSWRWCLLINLPLCLVTVVAATRTLRESREAGERPRFDIPGTVLGTVGIGVLVFGFAHAGSESGGWADPLTIGSLIAGLAILGLFVLCELRTAQPLLPMRLLANPSRAGALLANLLIFSGVIGLLLYLIYYLQNIQHFSAVESGLACLPYALGAVIAAAVLEQPLGRMPRRWPVATAMLIATAVAIYFHFLDADWNYGARLAPMLAILGPAVLAVFVVTSGAVIDAAPESDAGVCSALFNASQQLAFSLGPALLTSISLTASGNATRDGRSPVDSQIHGYNVGAIVIGALFVGGIIVAVTMLRPSGSPHEPNLGS